MRDLYLWGTATDTPSHLPLQVSYRQRAGKGSDFVECLNKNILQVLFPNIAIQIKIGINAGDFCNAFGF